MVTSLGCCSSLPGDTCLRDVLGGSQAGQQNLEVLREPGRGWLSWAGTVAQCARQESQSTAAGMAAKSCRASPGSQQGCVWGPGRVREGPAPSASGSFSHSLGFSCWGRRNQLELWEAKGTGAMDGTTPWEGAIGGGKVTVALVTGELDNWAGTGELDNQRGELGWFAPSSAWCSCQCQSAVCGCPLLGHRAVTRFPGLGFGCSRLPDACGSR